MAYDQAHKARPWFTMRHTVQGFSLRWGTRLTPGFYDETHGAYDQAHVIVHTICAGFGMPRVPDRKAAGDGPEVEPC
jgi:hypothetical protein